jgi:hypothetical protein
MLFFCLQDGLMLNEIEKIKDKNITCLSVYRFKNPGYQPDPDINQTAGYRKNHKNRAKNQC